MYAADEKGDKTAADAAKEAAYVDSAKIKPYSDKTDKKDTKTEFNDSYQKAASTNTYIDETPVGDYLSLNSPPKYKLDSNASLTGQDMLLLPPKAKMQLLNYKEEYSKAEAELNYMEMNKIHKESAELRQKYYDFVDDYDYSHGGLYDIYTNYSDSYDENGHYEYVYKMNATQLKNLCFDTQTSFNGAPSETDVAISSALGFASLIVDYIIPSVCATGVLIGSVGYTAVKGAYNSLMQQQAEALENASVYGHGSADKSNDVDFYIYLLDGGYSPEIKIRAVNKNTGETIEEAGFDLKQYDAYKMFANGLSNYGEQVCLNRRLWKYSYIKR